MMDGQTNGNVIFNVAIQVPAPRIFAASSISDEIRSSADFTKIKISGKDCSAITTARPVKVYTFTNGASAPVTKRQAWLIKPEFGPASKIQPMAPR